MSVGLSSAVTALVATVGLTGCVKGYRHPDPDDPHALIKVRLVYHESPGPQLDERVLLDGHALRMPPIEGGVRRVPITTGFRVRPEPALLELRSRFYTPRTRQVLQTYQENQRYACGTTRTTYGSQTQYCNRSQTKTRMVTQHYRDENGNCRMSLGIVPSVGQSYLVQFDFHGHQRCSVHCFVENPNAPPEAALTAFPCGS